MDFAMSNTSQKRALSNYRKRLKQRGMARFEVLGLDADRELIRRSRGGSPTMARNRRGFGHRTPHGFGRAAEQGGILSALRRSPLVGADLNLKRPVVAGRKVDREPPPSRH